MSAFKTRLKKRLKRFARHVPGASSRLSRLVGPAPKTRAEIFDDVYTVGTWGRDNQGRTSSGGGSYDPDVVVPYVEAVKKLVDQLAIRTATDLGCGDFAVGSQLYDSFDKYEACDVSDVILERNRELFQSPNLSFRKLDLVAETPPKAELGMVRQVLQHLSNDEIADFVEIVETKRPFRYLLVTEHLAPLSKFRPNLDISTGAGTRMGACSGVDLAHPPFNLQFKSSKIILDVRAPVKRFSDTVIRSTLYEF